MLNLIRPRISAWGSSLILNPQLSLALPEYSQMWDYGRIAPSSAVGSVAESIRGAAGEFLERKHFYNEIIPTGKHRLDESMGYEARESFTRALLQTSGKNKEDIFHHSFKTSKAYNFFSLEEVAVPSIFISLTNYDIESDSVYLPSRDTTGCAAHVDLDKSIDSSLKELLERQCLLNYWLTAQSNSTISLGEFQTSNLDLSVINLIERFLSSGDLRIYDISIPEVPGYAILSIYGSQSDDARVKYSAGLSCSWSAKSALEKSILELWQCFVFLHYFDVSEYEITEVDDPYHRHFWESNSYSTFSNFSKTKSANLVSVNSYISQPDTNKKSIESGLENLTSNIYLYINSERVRGKTIWYTKIFSPDFFLHMDFSNAINHDNVIRELCSTIIPERKTQMVPFP